MGENIIALPADRIADRQALLSDPMAPAQEVAARLINHLGTSR